MNFKWQIEEYLHLTKQEIQDVSADGHCIIYAVLASDGSSSAYNDILLKLEEEARNNWSNYQEFVEYKNQKHFSNIMTSYLNDKQWNTDFGDLVPLMMSNILKKSITILALNGSSFEIREINHEKYKSNLKVVFETNHYRAIVIKSEENKDNIKTCPSCSEQGHFRASSVDCRFYYYVKSKVINFISKI